MFQSVDAIYEDGVLKPLEPLELVEHQRVRVSVVPEAPNGKDVAAVVARQRLAMEELDTVMQTLPDNSPDDDV